MTEKKSNPLVITAIVIISIMLCIVGYRLFLSGGSDEPKEPQADTTVVVAPPADTNNVVDTTKKDTTPK